MDHDRASANLRYRKMWRGDSLARIAPAIHRQYREIAAMAGGAERPQMPLGVGGIVVTAGGKACGRFALIHPRTTLALFMNMKTVLTRGQPGKLGRDHQAAGAVSEGHRPQVRAGAAGIDRVYRGR